MGLTYLSASVPNVGHSQKSKLERHNMFLLLITKGFAALHLTSDKRFRGVLTLTDSA